MAHAQFHSTSSTSQLKMKWICAQTILYNGATFIAAAHQKHHLYDPFVPSSGSKHGFIILCLPTKMQVQIARKSLPPFVDPSLLRLDDPRCGVVQMDDNDIRLTTPLDSCGTIRRWNSKEVELSPSKFSVPFIKPGFAPQYCLTILYCF